MNTRIGVLLALVALGLCCAIGPVMADNNGTVQGMPNAYDIQPYTGPIGPDSSLYGLKLAFENLDDSFTFNQTELLEKEVDHADTRVAELESALAANQSDAADRAMDQYWQDMNQTEQTISLFNGTGFQPAFNGTYDANRSLPWFNGTYTGNGYGQGPNEAAMFAAQQKILLHQDILQQIADSHPDNRVLARAYNTSVDAEKRFEDRTQVHFDLERDADHHIIFHPVILNPGVRNHIATPYAWNQTRSSPANPGNGQNTGQVSQAWQDQHRQNSQVTYNQSQAPANYQDYRYGNTSTGGYDNGNGGRDTRFRFP